MKLFDTQNASTSSLSERLDLFRLDRVIILILLGLVIGTLLLLWRGNQVGTQLVSLAPANGRDDVSVLAEPRRTADRPEVLYVGQDEADVDQLFKVAPAGGQSIQLTQEAHGVFDYALSPDAATIAYAALREDGGSDLGAVSSSGGEPYPLLTCPEAVCRGAAWAPDGQRLIYERRAVQAPEADPGPPRLWWLDVRSGETAPLFEDNQMLGYGAAWSPDGQWLSYVAPSSQGVQLYNLENGQSVLIPSQMGGRAVWSPDGETLLVSDIRPQAEGFAVHLLKATPEDGRLTDISGEGEIVEDSSPAWSPDGEWLAITRKVAGALMGKQIWLMRADGSSARYLTNDTAIHHSLPQWSPDGTKLVYHRFPLKEINTTASIWLLDIETGQARQLVEAGNRPTWRP